MLNYGFFEDFQFIVHQVNKYLMFIDLLFLNDLDGTFDIGFFMFCPHNFPKRSTSQWLEELIVLQNIGDFLETFEILEGDESSVSLCSLHVVNIDLVFHK